MNAEKIMVVVLMLCAIAVAAIIFLTGVQATNEDIERECLLRGEVELNGEVYTCELKEETL